VRRTSINILWILLLTALTGCYKPLFPTNQPRTQYETYDRMHNEYAPLEETDVFGQPVPALRTRLGPP
jgi:hypothetical protein